jgi:hypothetical protein
MSALIVVAALAAQVSAPSGAAPTGEPAAAQHPLTGSNSYVDLEAGAGYSTNPNFELGGNTGAGFGRISAHGVHTRVSVRTTTVLSAFAQGSFYARNYGAQPSLNLSARHDATVSESLHVFGDASFTYDQGGQLDTRILSLPDVPLPPGGTQPPLLTPTGDFVSVTGKHFGASAHAGAQLALSSRDSLVGSTGLDHSSFKSGGIETHYNIVPVSIGYDRKLSEFTTVGARLGAQFTDYSGPSNTTIVTPQLTVQTLLSERLTFSGAIGASFSKVNNGLVTEHSTGVAANASLCSVGERSRFCGYASVNQDAATVAGPARTISAGLDYSLQLDANQTIQLSVDGSHYSTPNAILLSQAASDANYFRIAADYTRHLGSRWFAGANLSARKDELRARADPNADISGSLFVRYRLGDIQ